MEWKNNEKTVSEAFHHTLLHSLKPIKKDKSRVFYCLYQCQTLVTELCVTLNSLSRRVFRRINSLFSVLSQTNILRAALRDEHSAGFPLASCVTSQLGADVLLWTCRHLYFSFSQIFSQISHRTWHVGCPLHVFTRLSSDLYFLLLCSVTAENLRLVV